MFYVAKGIEAYPYISGTFSYYPPYCRGQEKKFMAKDYDTIQELEFCTPTARAICVIYLFLYR